MKKTATIFSIIGMVIGLIGLLVTTVYLVIHLTNLGTYILVVMNGEDFSSKLSFEIITSIVFLLLGAYLAFVAITGLLTYKVITQNVLDKIKKFGVLSIIFLNPVGGIFTIVYDKQLKKYLEETAPKGKRKEATKVAKE